MRAPSRVAAPIFAGAALLLPVASATALTLDCSSEPPEPPAATVELLSPEVEGLLRTCQLEVAGRVSLDDRRGHDVYVVVDSSGSTAGASGLDLDRDGLVGSGDWRSNSDPDDSTLAAELEAVRRALTAWEDEDVRVALIEYSAVIPIPPGEVEEQGPIRTVRGLTADFDAVRAALADVKSAGSVGATDYGGALLELAAEFDRSGDPSRRPIAFYLSDGKPTFPRYPYDATESRDVAWALEGADAVAARGLPVNALEIGTFDDIGVLAALAERTGGTLLPGLTGADILDSIASLALDGFVSVRLRNETSGEEVQAAISSDGSFVGTLALEGGDNEVTLTAVLRSPDGEWTLSCPIELFALCGEAELPSFDTSAGGSARPRPAPEVGDVLREPPWWLPRIVRRDRERGLVDATPGGGELDGPGGLERLPGAEGDVDVAGRGRTDFPGWPRPRHPWTRERLARWGLEPCPSLEGAADLSPGCAEAARQLAALLLAIEDEELDWDCRLDPEVVPGRFDDVRDLVDELERALDRDRDGRCADAALAASRVTEGDGLAGPISGPDPPADTSFECSVLVDGTELDVTVDLDAPTPGEVLGEGGPCPARIRVEGGATGRGTNVHDVYFVVDSSGSTAGSSGRDLDGDGTDDSTLDAELAAVEAFVDALDPSLVRVALIEFSAVLPIPPGEPAEQGRIRTVQPLTSDFGAFRAAMDVIRTDGSVGATDYGGALFELAAEFDRNGDPTRGDVAFFLSDGKPTFPRFAYDSTEPQDVAHALDGAAACASRGIVVNTYEVGVFDDLSTLEDVATTTGGRFYPSLADGAIVDALPGSTLVGIESVTVENLLTGETVEAELEPDGDWEAVLDLAPGVNEIAITVTADGGEEVVECLTSFVGDCVHPPCAARPPEAWHEDECP